MKDRKFCTDLMSDYYMCFADSQVLLASEIIMQSAAFAATTNDFWKYSECCYEGEVMKYFTTNLVRLIE